MRERWGFGGGGGALAEDDPAWLVPGNSMSLYGLALPEAATRARAYVQAAIEQAPGLGRGHGPLNHVPSLTVPAS